MEDRRQINSLAIGEVGRAISFAPNGLFLAVGVGTEDKPDTPKTGTYQRRCPLGSTTGWSHLQSDNGI